MDLLAQLVAVQGEAFFSNPDHPDLAKKYKDGPGGATGASI
jgi:hypothetical protein